MKNLNLIAALLVSCFSFTALAHTLDNIMVIATEKAKGSISAGEKNFYTKQFEIALSNSGNPIDLAHTCLKAFSIEGKEFKLDTVDEDLVKGELKSGKLLKGMVVFSSKDGAVHNANLIKISTHCK
ncbi:MULTISPECIES: DUF4354 family protein [Arsenophonus]|uniref:DUF4354 family protein n=1 Tax=Arsenophonus TaxID=637 RepID=UPI0038790A4D